jgi:Flp pilus assembly protein TadG
MRTSTTQRKGAAATELAILLPFLALLFAATLDFGRIYHASCVLANASGTGATYASGTPFVPATSPDAARNAACREGGTLNPPLQPDQVTIENSGGYVTVTAVYDYPLITGVLFPERTVRLQRTTVMKTAPRPGD